MTDARPTPSVVADEELVEPIPMMLFCPKCGLQHVDAPDERTPDWTNPPHKSHLCHGCGTIWRPTDIPTEGVVAIQSRGSKDTVFYNRAALAASDRDVLVGENAQLREALEPFAEVAAWAERNGHDLKDFDMILRGPGEQIAGHLQAQSEDFIHARAALVPLGGGV